MTPENKGLVERLESHMGQQDVPVLLHDCREAAARIRELEAEVERLALDEAAMRKQSIKNARYYVAAEARCRKLEEALGEIVAVADAIDAPLVIRESLPPYAELKTRGRGALTAARALLDQADGEEGNA